MKQSTSNSHAFGPGVRRALTSLSSPFVVISLLFVALLAASALLPATSQPARAQSEATPEATPEFVIEAVLQTVNLPATQDAFTSSNQPGTNWGGDENLAVGFYTDSQDLGALRSFLRFEFPGPIPSGSTINSARIALFQRATTGIPSMRIVVQQPSGPWDEFGITWANQPGFTGGERASVFVDASDGFKEWDITSLAREWYSGQTPNHGVILEGLEEPNNRRLFHSRQSGNAALRPILIVDYTPPGTIPPPSSSFLHPVNPYQTRADFRVEWRADDPSGSGIDYYDVQVREPGQAWQDWQTRTAATQATYVGQHGRTYEFRVRAVNRAGIAEPFPDSPQTRTTVDLEPPVVNVTPLPAYTNFTTVLVAWTGSDNVSGIHNYDVQIRYGSDPWQDAVLNTTQTSYTLPGRENVLAQIRVRARDNAGNVSSYEAPSAITGTRLDTSPPRACVFRFIPGMIPNVTTFSVSWLGDDRGGSGVRTFDIQYRYNGGAWQPFETGVSFTSAAFNPPHGPGVYEFRARAVDVVGNQGQFRPTGSDASMLVGVELPAASYFLPLIRIPPTADPFLAQCRRES
jgi:hypothetical protein